MYEILVLCFLLYAEVHTALFNVVGQNNPLLCLSTMLNVLVLLMNHHQAKHTYLKHKYVCK